MAVNFCSVFSRKSVNENFVEKEEICSPIGFVHLTHVDEKYQIGVKRKKNKISNLEEAASIELS